MKCFNEDLVEHQKICNTQRYTHRDPEGLPAEHFPTKKSPATPKKKKIVVKKVKKTTKSSDDDDNNQESKSVSSKKSKKSVSSKKSKKSTSSKKSNKSGETVTSTGAEGYDGNNQTGEFPTEIFLSSDTKGNDSNASWRSTGTDPNASGFSFAGLAITGDGRDESDDEGEGKRKGMGRGGSDDDEEGEEKRKTMGMSTLSMGSKERSPKEIVNLTSVTPEEREVGWEKPMWSQELGNLRKTKNGAKLRTGADVVRPISKGVDSEP
jgi:hypothetical protein